MYAEEGMLGGFSVGSTYIPSIEGACGCVSNTSLFGLRYPWSQVHCVSEDGSLPDNQKSPLVDFRESSRRSSSSELLGDGNVRGVDERERERTSRRKGCWKIEGSVYCYGRRY